MLGWLGSYGGLVEQDARSFFLSFLGLCSLWVWQAGGLGGRGLAPWWGNQHLVYLLPGDRKPLGRRTT